MNIKRIAFAMILSLIFASVFFSCAKKEIKEIVIEEILYSEYDCPVLGVTGLENSIVGEWKLVKYEDFDGLTHEKIKSIDYSCDDITYHFRSDGKLDISKSFEGRLNNNSNHDDFKAGQYTYNYYPPNKGSSATAGVPIGLNITPIVPGKPFSPAQLWGPHILDRGSTLTLVHLGRFGPHLYFIRIQR